MKWLLRFLLWATLLSAPAVLVSGAWQRGLAQVARAALGLLGQDVLIEDVQVMAPCDLAIFTAMCLATTAPWRARRKALAIGLPALVGVEVATVVAGVVVHLVWPESSRASSLRLTAQARSVLRPLRKASAVSDSPASPIRSTVSTKLAAERSRTS